MIHLGKEKAVYSVLLPEIKEQLTKSLSDLYIHTANDKFLSLLREETIANFREWVKDIVDLEDFPYAYPVNGATHGIDQWLIENKDSPIQQGSGEYQWAKMQRPDIEVTNYPSTRAYVSNPYSATGNFDGRHLTYNVPMLLDCAFVGATMKRKIFVGSNVEAVTFSLSKGFSLNLFRCGFIFSRQPIAALESLMSFNYFNAPSVFIMNDIIKNFAVDYVHEKLKGVQKEICDEYSLTPSDCVFLATSTNPIYDHWKRGNGTNRLCLSREMVKRGFGSFDLGVPS